MSTKSTSRSKSTTKSSSSARPRAATSSSAGIDKTAADTSGISAQGMILSIVSATLVVLVLAVAIFGFAFVQQDQLITQEAKYQEDYQAVFLDNGQVYFGKIVRETGSEIELEDIYYLQVGRQQLPEGMDTEEALQASEEDLEALRENVNQPNISLVKLGNELHGPTDRMFIMKNNVLFTEDLRDDSQVVEAIAAEKDQRD